VQKSRKTGLAVDYKLDIMWRIGIADCSAQSLAVRVSCSEQSSDGQIPQDSQNCLEQLTLAYANLTRLLTIAVTLPVPVASAYAERVHSKLKLLKTALRSTSANIRMSDVIRIYVENVTLRTAWD